ncbi:YggS family pyridoxal phosphate-dependent enzyme [Sneathiella chinensis]|uniref:Pyridoxal phosphate homeostasis protein n=1 Tax=Sneathiella chinensis TaxID=349750 RepID=A0ABQ5TZG8_9PROT|nr:YggS family pyridoxal phosphate-dependent enzyme [Sneathiella chinensis]GLQ04958.1 YggS family pyridoxal phosphate enzyme [Sneathiella chinensis]
MTDIAKNLKEIGNQIEKTAKRWERQAQDVTLVAVSKKQPVEKIEAALEAGQRVFGENRVQEAQQKWPALKDRFSDIELHLIGPLQTNKAKEAVALFDVIQTVDRPKLARILAEEMKAAGKTIPVYVQVNIGEEEQKSGILPKDADAFIESCRTEHGLDVAGLMCIPPAEEQPAPFFAMLARIAARNGLEKLSMGMSGDYQIGVQFGATSVRVGTGIFGEREG